MQANFYIMEQRFGSAPIAHSISRSDGSLDALHSTNEGSLDSTARSQWHPDLQAVRNFLLERFEEWHKKKMKEAIAKGDICPRKVSAILDFPPSCGRGATPLSKEECIRIQQAWIKAKMEKSQEVEEDLDEDLSMCSEQGDDDLKDTFVELCLTLSMGNAV
ncbi:Uncharacterized protein TCM_028499 [Theobroma cacao]|uniref:Uncharacterized protein n=1 Tax=Theobroma cacao TaxID=3641 RepID=A0A061GAM7_THECC|nr:Uncharacterized protein TCM_028499 [Theobroma cacao]